MRALKQLLWWIIAASEGGFNRARIIESIHEMPANANQLAERLELDYKTIRHHLGVLEKNNIISTHGQKYGKMYFLSELLEDGYELFEEIWVKSGKNQLNKTDDRK